MQREFPQRGNHSLSKLGDRLQRRVTRGTRCLVPGGPGEQPDFRGFGLHLGQTHEAGAAPAPALPGIPGMATHEALGDS